MQRDSVNSNSPEWQNYGYFYFNSAFLFFFSVSNELIFLKKPN